MPSLLDYRSYGHCAALLAMLGCDANSTLPPCFPVRGKILLAGKPLAEAMVVFHNMEGDGEQTQKPLAYTDANGQFSLTTYKSADGAPAGKYAVTVELRAPRQAGEEMIRDGRNLLPARYSKPETSKLAAEVKEGDNEISPIDLSAR